jgi:hypothetical protein
MPGDPGVGASVQLVPTVPMDEWKDTVPVGETGVFAL